MTLAEDKPDRAVLVAIDVAKHRNEVLIEMPGRARRRRLTILNTRSSADTGVQHLGSLHEDCGRNNWFQAFSFVILARRRCVRCAG